MKAVILAAGLGTRMGTLGITVPKCLMEIDNKPILDHQINLLKNKNINDITVVIGTKGSCWTQENYDKIRERPIRTLINFENISKKRNFTLSIGIKNINSGPLLILDGDLYFNEEVLDEMLSCEGDIALLARDPENINDSNNKIDVEGNKVFNMGIDILKYPWKINAGFAKVSNNIFPIFKDVLYKPEFLESSFSSLINCLCKKEDVWVVTKNSGWNNINTLEDVEL